MFIRKHLANTLVVFLIVSTGLKAQSNTTFGVKGGLNLTFFNVEQANFGPNPKTQTSYYGGMFVDFYIDEALSLQPEVLYIGLGDFKFVNLPIYAKYMVAKNLDIMVGPSLNYFFDFFSNKFKVRGDISTAYHISKLFDLHIKYTLGFEVISPNGLFFGVGYRF
ncbi:PorT family protein [Psychroserpens algicola]|uniref:PorT family protein n=1 Tax=Psychroserpens algicola TaxID=1719034 RepID=A0ABT0H6B0_9FLAO|nr:PorT family protein [Psychroserpens algicola]MCK8479908.1 PorT family protein [Psychroserpens algicola]